jgi:predicted O-methyltransferase YrrM
MTDGPDIEIVDDCVFELRPTNRQPTKPDRICLRKNRRFTDRYLALKDEFKHCRMVEVGVDQGGSTSFFTKLLQPEALLAIELSNQPVETVMNFLAEHDPQKRVHIHWGVDQSDPVEVPRLVETTFADQPLDLVVDDASHLLIPTTATFEMLFPRLRPGGLYIIEDWSHRHTMEYGMKQAISANTDSKIAKDLAAGLKPEVEFEMPMSLLICQLTIASGYRPDLVTEVRTTRGFCEIRRGTADIASGTPVSDYIGYVGRRVFES